MNEHCILLVEDNLSDIDLTKRAFDRAHITNELVIAEDGAQALTLLFGDPGEGIEPMPLPALVLLDLKLPILDGLAVLKRIREGSRTRRLPVVILTSSKEEQDIAASYDLGVNSYIRKPIDFGQFAESVRQLGLYWLVINETPPPVA
jgi:two-component system, response regulator